MLKEGGIDIFVSHDWPAGIAHYGNKAALVGHKPFLEREIEDGSLGSAPAAELLHLLRPKYWFSAHLHTKFAAIVPHLPSTECTSSSTKFLALSKCLPGQRFLQIIDVPSLKEGKGMKLHPSSSAADKSFSYDAEWLAILKHTHHLLSLSPGRIAPTIFDNINNSSSCSSSSSSTISQQAIQEARDLMYKACPGGKIPNNFVPTAAAHNENGGGGRRKGMMPAYELRNPQTEQFLGMIGLEYNLDHPTAPSGAMFGGGNIDMIRKGGGGGGGVTNPEEIELLDDDEEEEDGGGGGGRGKVLNTALASIIEYNKKKSKGENPEEIELEEEDE
jgi:lariat debranching enzyme